MLGWCGHYPRGDPRFYSRIAESRSRREKTGCITLCPIFRCYSVFKASSPLPLGGAGGLPSEANKTPTSRRAPDSAPTFVGKLTSSAPSWLSKGPPTSTSEVYHLRAACQTHLTRLSSRFWTRRSQSARDILAPQRERSSLFRRGFYRLRDASVWGRNVRSGACQPEEPVPGHPRV